MTTIADFFRPFPKYLQIRDILLRRLEREMQPGQRFPTELALCAEFGVSRETIREALRSLEADGLISRQAGRGSFVLRQPGPDRERRLTGLAEDFSDLRLDTSAVVLAAGMTALPQDVAGMIGEAAGTPVFRIVRLRHFEGTPLAEHEAFLSEKIGARIAALDLRGTSIVRELASTLKIPFREEFQRVDAVIADTTRARLLETPLGSPLLHVTRLLRTRSGKLLVLFRSHFRADRYFYTVERGG